MAEAVADATVLIYLAKLDRLDSLWTHHEAVLVPEPVRREVVDEGKELGHPDAIVVERALDQGHLTATEAPDDVPDPLGDLDLEPGDRSVLAVSLGRDVPVVLTDDGSLRGLARAVELTPRGTLAFLVGALRDGALDFDAYLGCLERLTEAGFRMSAEVYARAVRRGREIAREG